MPCPVHGVQVVAALFLQGRRWAQNDGMRQPAHPRQPAVADLRQHHTAGRCGAGQGPCGQQGLHRVARRHPEPEKLWGALRRRRALLGRVLFQLWRRRRVQPAAVRPGLDCDVKRRRGHLQPHRLGHRHVPWPTRRAAFHPVRQGLCRRTVRLGLRVFPGCVVASCNALFRSIRQPIPLLPPALPPPSCRRRVILPRVAALADRMGSVLRRPLFE